MLRKPKRLNSFRFAATAYSFKFITILGETTATTSEGIMSHASTKYGVPALLPKTRDDFF